MKINNRYNFRIYPNQVQQEYFENVFGCCRFLYNNLLYSKTEYYLLNKDDKEELQKYKYRTEKELKQEFVFLKNIDSIALQQERRHLDVAFKNFFDKCKKKTRTRYSDKKIAKLLRKPYKDDTTKHISLTPDYPKFKSKYDDQSFSVTLVGNNIKIDFENHKIKIPKIDWIKFRDARIFNEKISSIVIQKNKCNQYFISILVEKEIEVEYNYNLQEDKIFAADMSCSNFLVSQEIDMENQHFYRKNERKLKLRQRRLSRSVKGSNNRNKMRLKLAKTHLDITNKRRGCQKNLAYQLVNNFDAFCFEDLNIKGMQKFNGGISKTVTLDFSWSEFLLNLEWMSLKHSKHFVKVSQWFPSSKLCHECGAIKEDLTLKDRTYICDCGYSENRDINAAKNIKREGIKLLQEKGINLLKKSTDLNISESYACGDMLEVVNSTAQESMAFRPW